MMFSVKTLSISVTLALVSAASVASDSTTLQQQLAKMTSLQADFKQTVTDINDKVIQQGAGTIALKTPNLLNWHLTSPDESLIIANDAGVWIYNPFAEEVTILSPDDIMQASPLALLVSHDESLWRQYQVSSANGCYSIKPLAVDSQVQDVNICMNGEALSSLAILDNQGNNSYFELMNQTPLSRDDQDVFNFVIPEGVDVDDQRQPVIGGE
ncbi:outer membrane lipoprotein chaperone LolA [Shewanella sp. NIFS-20-20]|uniref:outer membrane lipoprotein chaperone LolA n=1 Tax=Shewanella sp. NIFS-20-20 TaxID=2853806 RepID=UPI001C477588|nr:outer membrane lipoprotein chaperone LolA [Shewanella sp. NIFS-20-20]MBV7316885.1 outer membrane lipoprotein chaperone LolA [Shewanella sp. NIFS-20-20]